MNCLHCTAETSNGLALCDRCQIAASVILEFLPIYFRNLARWRPGRAGARPVPGSREPVDFSESTGADRIGNLLNDVGNDVHNWARALQDDRDIDLPEQGDEGLTISHLCRLFAENLTSIATLEWCGEFLRQLSAHEAKLRELTEKSVPGWYAGECQECGFPTHVVPGLTWVTCGGCGASTYAKTHLKVILREAGDWVAPPKQIAAVLVALIDDEVNVTTLYDRIRKWSQLEKLDAHRRTDSDGNPVGAKRYRLQDVLTLVQTDGESALLDARTTAV